MYRRGDQHDRRAPIVHWYAFKDVTAPVLSCTNQMFAANPNPQNPNGGCEAAVALEASASDLLICAELDQVADVLRRLE
ncbi:MAG: hypothetical protein IPJ39_15670 [Saprospiraceae bacterium]|nr:hypothetical protein [Saprospiraceae bacterium]